jgi:HEAT repeat protein
VNDVLAKLGAFTACKDSRLACAAAVILAELAPHDPSLVQQLVDALSVADALRRPFIIEALGRIGTPEAAAALVPLIKSEGPASEQALRAIAHTASAALKPLLKLVGTVPPALLERIAECAARTGETAAFQGLIGALLNADVDTCRAVRHGLRIAMSTFSDSAKANLRKQLEHGFKEKALIEHAPSLIALVKIAGDLGDISLQHYILDRIETDEPLAVRRAALQALATLHYSGEQRAKLAPKLLPILSESDLVNLAEPALEALRSAHLGGEHQAPLRKLLSSQSSRIREFAMQVLASQATTRTMNELLACLDSTDRSVREEALGALSRAPSAAGALCQRLIEMEGGEAATETAKALAPQAAKAPPRALQSLAHTYVALAAPNGPRKPSDAESIRRSDEKRRAILNVFRAGNTPELSEALLERARELRKHDSPMQAYQLLKEGSGLNGWTDEHRIEMALAGLSAGPKELGRSARSSDQNLRLLEDVLGSGRVEPKVLARRITRDESLSRKTIHYIGFHFVERMSGDRQFGQLLLEHLAEGRSEEAGQAKEKLVIEGLLKLKGAEVGILEQRAKVMLAASDLIATPAPAETRVRKPVKAASKPAAKTKAKAKPKHKARS